VIQSANILTVIAESFAPVFMWSRWFIYEFYQLQ